MTNTDIRTSTKLVAQITRMMDESLSLMSEDGVIETLMDLNDEIEKRLEKYEISDRIVATPKETV